jgi:geranylgeranyl diphosphate synthase type II
MDKWIEDSRHLIEKRLTEVVRNMELPPAFEKVIQYALSGGKRMRPLLVMASAKAAGGNGKEKKTVDVGCAIEMVHCFSLVHDDLPSIDNDDTRRGRPTCHRKFGESSAILAGDLLLAGAFRLLSKGTKISTIKKVSQSTTRMITGEQQDIALVKGPEHNITESQLVDLYRRKTAALFSAACSAGAESAALEENQLSDFADFGENLGIVFQIGDDIQDTSDELNFVQLFGIERAKMLVTELVPGIHKFLNKYANSGKELTALTDMIIASCHVNILSHRGRRSARLARREEGEY